MQGFVRGDLDPSFPLDAKFRELRRQVGSDRYYAATGVYFHVAAEMWRVAERPSARTVCYDADQAVDDLVSVGLLDGDGCITRRAFANTVARARKQRRAAADRQARNRAQKSHDVTRDNPVTHALVGTVRDGTDTSLLEGTREEPRDPADAYWSLTGKYPTEKTLSWVDDLTAKYGGDATIRALVTAHTADRATATLIGRAQDILRAEARQLDRKEREDEKRRLAEKRAIPRIEEPWRAEYRESIRRHYEELDGAA